MTQQKTPIGEIALVGAVAVQLYSRVYYGRIEYFAEIGKPWTNRQNGVTKIIPQMKGAATRDYVAAAELAAQKLDELQRAQFQHGVYTAAQSVSPLEGEALPSPSEEPLKLKLA
ncbi:hypothetical protein [Botrimarina mediterranea]|uniref:Uncharacterized protein n=1 Tax=Botrimarina mediterranea TaxID=2528022 RepID=A0A518K7A2_9BACT|nr:hypothetical protein [Botrimarina mediterranea]QDV73683.1 hypothetical protein Spa11_18820 [Botrimarina mediterranea]QDV78273.1 hypothetical protein K2D_18800 [Planctomycetes bacterium K2D]